MDIRSTVGKSAYEENDLDNISDESVMYASVRAGDHGSAFGLERLEQQRA